VSGTWFAIVGIPSLIQIAPPTAGDSEGTSGWADWLASELVVGAFIASLAGIATYRWQERHRSRNTRRALRALLDGELTTMSDPPFVTTGETLSYSQLHHQSLTLLLTSGVLDARTETHLLMDLIYLSTVIDEYNERARIYHQALIRETPYKELEKLAQEVNFSNEDYRKASREMLTQLWVLGDPLPIGESPQYGPVKLVWRWGQRRIETVRGRTRTAPATRKTPDGGGNGLG
jgi:hypothetical protein